MRLLKGISVHEYAQALKKAADALRDVNKPVTESEMVLALLAVGNLLIFQHSLSRGGSLFELETSGFDTILSCMLRPV